MSNFGDIDTTRFGFGSGLGGGRGPGGKKSCYIFNTSYSIMANYNKTSVKAKQPDTPLLKEDSFYMVSFKLMLSHQLIPMPDISCELVNGVIQCRKECVWKNTYTEDALGCDPNKVSGMTVSPEFVFPQNRNGPGIPPNPACMDQAGEDPPGLWTLPVNAIADGACSKGGLVCLTEKEAEEVLFMPWTDKNKTDGGHWNFIVEGNSSDIRRPVGSGGPPDGMAHMSQNSDMIKLCWELLKFIGEVGSGSPFDLRCGALCCLLKHTGLGPMVGQSTKKHEAPDSAWNNNTYKKLLQLMLGSPQINSGAIIPGATSFGIPFKKGTCCRCDHPDTKDSDHPKLEAECPCEEHTGP